MLHKALNLEAVLFMSLEYSEVNTKYWIPRDIEKNNENWEKFHERFSEWSKTWQYPVAMVTSVSDIGPKLSCLCYEEGLEIPKDVAILSSDNDIAYCEGFSPTISSVNIDYFDVGYQAAKRLDYKIRNIPLEEELTLIPPTEVIYRESTNYYAVDDGVVKKAMTFISDNYTKNIQIDDVVRNFELSRRSLEKRFKDAVGHTIFEEISRLRIETMKHLLLQTDESVKVLSQKAGFSNGQHMRRAFKQHTGYIPKEFRRVNKPV